MMTMRIVLPLILLIGAIQSPNNSQGSGWRGIVPLHSTRNEVDKLLGPPSEIRSSSAVYHTNNETVTMFYSNGAPCGTKSSSWRVQRDTVIAIDVTPRRSLPLTQFHLDEAKYRKKSGGDRPEDIYYVNEEKGEVLRVFKGEVLDLHYGPTSRDTHLQCVPIKRQ
jgi:hypothetical protein